MIHYPGAAYPIPEGELECPECRGQGYSEQMGHAQGCNEDGCCGQCPESHPDLCHTCSGHGTIEMLEVLAQ